MVKHEHWLKVAAKLRVDRKESIAPHKPLLLLVVASLVEGDKLIQPVLPLTGELTFRFLAFWAVVAERRSQRPDIRLPFFHLQSDGFWTALDFDGHPTTERRRVERAQLNSDFHTSLQDLGFRTQFRRVLIAKYFSDPAERAGLYDLVGVAAPPDEIVKADARMYADSCERGREARFRLTVVPAYNYTCALTGYRCVTLDAGSIVDAAHIHQFADSRNNHPQNGIALSKNAHWFFDQGLWSLTDDHEVIIAADRFHESGEGTLLLRGMAGRRIHLPSRRDYWPEKTYLAWHRKKWQLG